MSNANTPLTAKQTNFAHAIVSGMSQADAYRTAYDPNPMTGNALGQRAHEVGTNSKVVVKVAELRKPLIAAARYGKEEAMAEALEAFTVAKGKENGGAMVAAAQLRAKLNGLLVDKTEDLTDPFKKALNGMSAEKAQSMLDAMEQVQVIQAKAATI